MKKSIVLLVFMISGLYFSQVNIEEIKKNVTENPQKYYYEYLKIFKTNPKTLSQDQLNYIYYGNNYVNYGYKRSEFNDELNEITKFSNRKISSKKVSDLLDKAKILYEKNPLNKELIQDLSILYSKTGNIKESELYTSRYELLYETIKNSGTGKLDNSPIIVTSFSDKFYAVEHFSGIFSRGIEFSTKVLPDGSWLDVFKNGTHLFFVKTVHHKDMYRDDK
ncbi:protein of unknown function [Chryseobacterium sp. RU37D]|uniref:DUF4919 domain-containing protein n=1 Tax=Chryseobacterium sp. RU37D TaxID=1907397 RepID=UPI000953F704|nr:DUF4919 domain-containing protein [Chryseobacterium sp. RU37D]SIQ13237.1 protein of unknown function [Chryseobacterium sp. RU37D]